MRRILRIVTAHDRGQVQANAVAKAVRRDSHWEQIRHDFPEENISEGCPGRRPVPTRKILEAVLWILNTGAQWHMLPQCCPNYKKVHRRFQTLCQSKILRRVLTDIANELRARGVLDEEESLIDATFAMAKGGGADVGPTKRGLQRDECQTLNGLAVTRICPIQNRSLFVPATTCSASV
jgi:transposase